MSSKYLFESKTSLLRDFFLVQLVVIFIVILVSILSHNERNDMYWRVFGAFLLISMVQIFLTKRIAATRWTLLVSYPLLPFKGAISINFCDVSKVYFGSNNSVYDPYVLKVFLKSNKSVKFYFTGEANYQQLINLMRELGITVEVNSHIWK